MSKILNIEPLGFPWKTQNPFLFCAYHYDNYPEGNTKMGVNSKHLEGRHIGNDFYKKDGWRMYHGEEIPGFPYHPHRGFETITINHQGVVDHADSLGATGRFMEGDVQWMTAGKGIQHSEMFPLMKTNARNPLEIFQIWLNLPSASKFVEPHFKMLWKEDIPIITKTDKNGQKTEIQLITGNLFNTNGLEPAPNSWAHNPQNAIGIYTLKLQANAEITLPKTDENAHRTLFLYASNGVTIEGAPVKNEHYIEVLAGEPITVINEDKEARFLVLEGKPINEPVVQHGPYVMNTVEEIKETMRDYGRTQFGGWPWPEKETVHPTNKGRFAKHADGREEHKA